MTSENNKQIDLITVHLAFIYTAPLTRCMVRLVLS